ncbi:MAG: DUF1501 domain-containing protein [Chloroflexi bacterium]|nr:DUF1501 domain-containing protein [Chloroflexota bacterium]
MPNLLTRRKFFESAAVLAGAVAWPALPAWMPRLAFAPKHSAPRGDTLIVVFLRGAADCLNVVVPHGDQAYYAKRPTLGIPRPDDNKAKANLRAIDLDGFFGFHPNLKPLMPAWQAGHLAIVHACGAPDESRSHFKAMELMERGVDDEKGPASGWIGRHLATLDTGNRSPLRAIGLGQLPQRSLGGSVPVSALRSIADFHLGGDLKALAQMRAALTSLYSGDDPLNIVGQETLDIMDAVQALDPLGYTPAITNNQYPETEFGLGLKQIAMLIKAEVGLEVAAIDLGGWDTHFAQGGSEGLMAGLLKELGDGLAAFHEDTTNYADRLTIVTMSEFGRRVQENGSLGTDHGHGSLMMLMGGHVMGNKVHGQWPGLADSQLVGPGDLAVTTDYRDVLAEVCLKRLNNPAVDQIFPNYKATPRGLLRA